MEIHFVKDYLTNHHCTFPTDLEAGMYALFSFFLKLQQ